MKNKLFKPVNENLFSKINMIDNHASSEITKSKKNRRAKDFGLTFILFYLKMILKHIVKLCHLLKLFFR